MFTRDGPFHARITDVILGNTPEESYAVAVAEDKTALQESFTISLGPSKGVWPTGETLPEKHDVVVVEKLKRKVLGWRAVSARPMQPSDED